MSLPKPYYDEDGITIYHADCMDILPYLPKVDLVLTSPPYDGLRDYCGYSFDFQPVARLLAEGIKTGGVIVWIVGDQVINGSESLTSFKQAIYFKEVCELNLHDTMIYFKNCAIFPDPTRYYQSFEYMFVFSKGKPKTVNLLKDRKNRWAGEKSFGKVSRRQASGELVQKGEITVQDIGIRMNVWEIQNGYGNSTKDEIAYQHPAIFPENLAKDHILSWSNPGDLVLDCFMGSGTTAKMAKETGRKCIGIEMEEKYCEIAVNRLRQQVMKF